MNKDTTIVELKQPVAFESRILPLFSRRTPGVAELIPKLYLHGLATGDFNIALRELLGDDAPLLASTVMRLKEKGRGDLKSGILETSRTINSFIKHASNTFTSY